MSPVIVWSGLGAMGYCKLTGDGGGGSLFAVPWDWVCCQMISQAEILDSIVW